jgi:hypothetical protein
MVRHAFPAGDGENLPQTPALPQVERRRDRRPGDEVS